MSTLVYAADAEYTIKTDEQLLSEVQAKYSALLSSAQEYTIVGSRTVKNPQFQALRDEISRLEQRCLYARGYTGRNAPDFSTNTSADDLPE